ncbi:hypothetical protein HK096_000956, partial [Nowakowskiella sp. JEL0078]
VICGTPTSKRTGLFFGDEREQFEDILNSPSSRKRQLQISEVQSPSKRQKREVLVTQFEKFRTRDTSHAPTSQKLSLQSSGQDTNDKIPFGKYLNKSEQRDDGFWGKGFDVLSKPEEISFARIFGRNQKSSSIQGLSESNLIDLVPIEDKFSFGNQIVDLRQTFSLPLPSYQDSSKVEPDKEL